MPDVRWLDDWSTMKKFAALAAVAGVMAFGGTVAA